MTSFDGDVEEWRNLYRAALAFRDLKPWMWMSDSQLFGVQSPASKETLYCAVLGSLGEVFALVVYPGRQGLSAYLHLAEGDMPARDFRTMMRCLMAEFEDRAALEFQERDQIKSLGLSIRGSKAWPMFRSHSPWKFPWMLVPDEVPILTVALEQAVDVCSRARSDPELLPEDPASILIRAQARPDGPWQDLVERLPDAVEEIIPVAAVKPSLVAELKSGPLKRMGTWEIDFGCAPQPLQEIPGSRPVVPLLLMITDRDSGIILSLELSRGTQGAETLRDHVIAFAKKHRHLPTRWHVCKRSVFDAMDAVTRELGVVLERKPVLPSIDEAYESLVGSLEGDAEALDLLGR